MTFEGALKKIQAKFTEVDASKLADMAVQVTLTDEDCGGTLYFKVTNGAVDVQGYDYRDNDAIIDIDRKALMDILSGKSTLDKAVDKGAATVKGNFEKLDTLKAAIPEHVPVKKPAVKKTAAKKAEAPKAAPAKKTAAKKTTAVTPAKKAEPVKKTAVKKAEPAKKVAAVKKADAEKKPAEKKSK